MKTQESIPEPHPASTAWSGHDLPQFPDDVSRARAFAEPLLGHQNLVSGENALDHAGAMAAIVAGIGGSAAMQSACYLVYAAEYLNQPRDVIAKAFGEAHATLAMETLQLLRLQRQALQARSQDGSDAATSAVGRHENVRRMLLAFSRDLRVVLLRLSSRLQTLRWYAASRQTVPHALADESLQVLAPLANRLGIWQIKWELEDLSFRFLEPQTYRDVARLLDETRTEREQSMARLRAEVEQSLLAHGIQAQVQGRPKHIYSIVKKMRGKSLRFEQIFDLRALRVVVPAVADCYAALSLVHTQFQPVVEEFDDYIARPKSNGYQSLHTVVRDLHGRAIEIQIRTREMHEHAEHGVAAHWAYKEAGTKGYAGVSASGSYDAKIAVLRQLLAWERDMSNQVEDAGAHAAAQQPDTPAAALSDRIYVLTPDAAVVELPQGATAIDFAYSVHTNLGHRCRGARVDGAMVPLNTPLRNGQTVEIVATKEGGPSRDWLNPELGFLASSRSRSKVRAWFNAQIQEETMAHGREVVEKLLQREGKTSVRLDDLAERLGFKSADALFEAVGKDTVSQRQIEMVLNPAQPAPSEDDAVQLRRARGADTPARSGVLVVGVDSLLTQLARCCKPAPPDDISGFVTRGKGVSVHRQDCPNFQRLQQHSAGRVIEVDWGRPRPGDTMYYPVDVSIEAMDRQGLLRDISDVFAKEKTNVIGVQTQSVKGVAWMTFTVEVSDTERLHKVLALVRAVAGVRSARRR
jgi:GTP pyrophosphokinase